MKKCTFFLALSFCLTGITAYAQSLADIAREEQKRRDSLPGGVKLLLGSPLPTVPEEKNLKEDNDNIDADVESDNRQNPGVETDGEDSDEKTAPDELKDLNGKPESYWRNVMSDARDNLKRLEEETKELSYRRNTLQLLHARTNGARRAPIQNEIDQTRREQELNIKNLEAARVKLQSLRDEARSSGALPGWVE